LVPREDRFPFWNFRLASKVGPRANQHWGVPMQNPAKFREYAEQCERLAKTASEKDRAALLEIAAAWLACAAEAERKWRNSAEN
jgi:hypothetical protein